MNKVSPREAQIIRRVRDARDALGLTQEQVGAALSLSKYGYGHYEREVQPFTVDQLFTLSRVLGRSVEWFLGLETGLSEREDHLLTIYKGLSPTARGLLLDMAETFAKSERERGEGK